MQENNKKNLFEYVALLGALVGFVPMLFFLYRGLIESPQLRDAIIILCTVLLVIAIEYKIRPTFPTFSRNVIYFLALSYALLFFNNYLIRPNFDVFASFVPVEIMYLFFVLIMFLAFACFIAAVGFSMFKSKRYVLAISGGFFSFSILSILFQFVDLPLRIWAGRVAGYILSIFGENVRLLMYKGEIPQIALRVNEQSYLVATECNGFGIISSCLILSIVIAIFRKSGVFNRIFAVFSGIIIGFVANSLRIVSIITVSLLVGNKHYYFYHEALGYLFFVGALLLVWTLLSSKKR